MGLLGRPQIFSPIRRSSLYLADIRFDIQSLSSHDAVRPLPQVGPAISTAALASPVNLSRPARASPAGEKAGLVTARAGKVNVAPPVSATRRTPPRADRRCAPA